MKNFYTDVATALKNSELNEAYVLADGVFQGCGSDDVDRVLREYTQAPGGLVDILNRDYLHLPSEGLASPMFRDGVHGHVMIDGVAIEFSIAKVGSEAYRVLFHKVDAGELLVSLRERVIALERR